MTIGRFSELVYTLNENYDGVHPILEELNDNSVIALDDFVTGKGNHLAVVKIGNTGVTYKPLNRVIINYFDSNAENLAPVQDLNHYQDLNQDDITRIYLRPYCQHC